MVGEAAVQRAKTRQTTSWLTRGPFDNKPSQSTIFLKDIRGYQARISGTPALVPKPRANLTRFHGVFVGVPHQPNSKYRALVTPAKRGKGNKRQGSRKTDDCTPAKRHSAMTWAQRLKRVFNIDITTCETCGGAVKVIASIEDPAVIKQILGFLY